MGERPYVHVIHLRGFRPEVEGEWTFLALTRDASFKTFKTPDMDPFQKTVNTVWRQLAVVASGHRYLISLGLVTTAPLLPDYLRTADAKALSI